MLRYLPFLLVLAVWIYAFIDCLNTPEKEVRKLPKVAWAIIILLFGQVLLGPVAWFIVGRPRKNAPYGAVKPQERQWVAPDDNPDFLKSLGNDGKDGDDGTAEAESRGGAGRDAEAEPAPEPEKPRDRPADQGAGSADAESGLRRWEDDLRRREDELRRRENGNGGGPEDPPAK